MLPPTTDPNGDDTLAPVFWWHGKLAAISAGSLRLLLTAAPLEGFALSSSKNSRGVFVEYGDNEQTIVTGHLYRWDRGLLSPIAGTWLQAGW